MISSHSPSGSSQKLQRPGGGRFGLARILGWALVVAAGVTALAVLAWGRGENVSALWIVLASVCVFAVAYRFHSAWLMAKVLAADDLRATASIAA